MVRRHLGARVAALRVRLALGPGDSAGPLGSKRTLARLPSCAGGVPAAHRHLAGRMQGPGIRDGGLPDRGSRPDAALPIPAGRRRDGMHSRDPLAVSSSPWFAVGAFTFPVSFGLRTDLDVGDGGIPGHVEADSDLHIYNVVTSGFKFQKVATINVGYYTYSKTYEGEIFPVNRDAKVELVKESGQWVIVD